MDTLPQDKRRQAIGIHCSSPARKSGRYELQLPERYEARKEASVRYRTERTFKFMLVFELAIISLKNINKFQTN
ncbi:hypothetical protein ABD07_07485 [Nitrosomonas oligotropha]|nr:hypothetical protein [Nitrosomonas oligotropha]